jgi:hypothetical protein
MASFVSLTRFDQAAAVPDRGATTTIDQNAANQRQEDVGQKTELAYLLRSPAAAPGVARVCGIEVAQGPGPMATVLASTPVSRSVRSA